MPASSRAARACTSEATCPLWRQSPGQDDHRLGRVRARGQSARFDELDRPHDDEELDDEELGNFPATREQFQQFPECCWRIQSTLWMRGALLLCILRAVGAFTPLHMERAAKSRAWRPRPTSGRCAPPSCRARRSRCGGRPGSAALTAAAALETASYPADEAASPARLAERATVAGEFFLGLFDISGGAAPAADPPLVGFVCATAAPLAGGLTEAAMGTHDAAGELLCVHSVVVAPRWRPGRRGAMLRAYLRAVAGGGGGGAGAGATAPRVRACALIAKARLVGLHARAGRLVGQSAIVHGADPWFELRGDLGRSAPTAARGAGAGAAMLQCDAFTAAGSAAIRPRSSSRRAAATPRGCSRSRSRTTSRRRRSSSRSTTTRPPPAAATRTAPRRSASRSAGSRPRRSRLWPRDARRGTRSGRPAARAPTRRRVCDARAALRVRAVRRPRGARQPTHGLPADAPAPLDAVSALADGAGSGARRRARGRTQRRRRRRAPGRPACARSRAALTRRRAEPEAVDALETDGTALAKIDTRGVVPTCAGAGADARAAAAGAPRSTRRASSARAST